MSRPSLIRASRVFRLTMVAALALPLLAVTASAQEAPRAGATPGNELSYEQASQRLDRLLTQAERVRGLLDQRQIDLAALSADLGVDAAGIVGYVTEQMAFEQYSGVLRGPEGTLLSRGGNAFDLAILLATLLTTAGYEVVIERGELTREQSEALIRQMASPRFAPEPIGNIDAIVSLLRQIGRTAEMPAAEIEDLVEAVVAPAPVVEDARYAPVVDDAEALRVKLAEAGVAMGAGNLVAELEAEATDYAWLRYRKDAEQPWTEVHPAFKEGEVTGQISPTSSFVLTDGIPAELLHRVRIDVTLERNLNGVLEARPITAPFVAAAMDVGLVPLDLAIVSNAVYENERPDDAGEIIEQTNLFLALFRSAVPDGTSTAFGLDGALYSLEELEDGAFGVQPQTGEVVADSLGDAVEALDAMGGDPAGTPVQISSSLTAVWVDYTVVAPGGMETTVRRTVVDRIGPARRAAGKVEPAEPDDREAVAAALLRKGSTMIATGSVPQVYVIDAALRYVVTAGPELHAMLRRGYFPDESGAVGQVAEESGWSGNLPLLASFDRLPAAGVEVVAYRHRPTIVTYRESTRRDPAKPSEWVVSTAVDVVGNARRVLSVASGTVEPAPAAALTQGVWETYAEEAGNPNPYDLPQQNTMLFFAEAEARGADITVVRDDTDLARLELDPDTIATLSLDLARGFVVVVPVSATKPGGSTGWWRVSPSTGETLGMTSDGGGQSALEYTLLFSIACAGYAGFSGWGPLTTLVQCGGLIGGYGLSVLGFSALLGLVVGAIGLVIGNEFGARNL